MKKNVVALFASCIVLSAIVAAMEQVKVPIPVCVDKRGCGPAPTPSKSNPDAAREDERVAAAAALEREQLGRAAYLKGNAAFAEGKWAVAAGFYLTATRHQPDNLEYKKQRARALTAHRNSLGFAIDEIRGAGDVVYDGREGAVTLRPVVTVKEAPAFADSLAKSFEIGVNINDPANIKLKVAMSQMEERIKYDRFAKVSEGQVPPDPVGLEKSVAAFNEVAKAVRPPGAAPVTVEEVTTVYNRYQLSLKVKK